MFGNCFFSVTSPHAAALVALTRYWRLDTGCLKGNIRGADKKLTGSKVSPVERVGLLGSTEPGVLPHCPRPRSVHGRVGAPWLSWVWKGANEVRVGRAVTRAL